MPLDNTVMQIILPILKLVLEERLSIDETISVELKYCIVALNILHIGADFM